MQGWASTQLQPAAPSEQPRTIEPLLEAIINHIPPPTGRLDDAFAMLVAMVERDPFVGRVATGRVASGRARVGDQLRVLSHTGVCGLVRGGALQGHCACVVRGKGDLESWGRRGSSGVGEWGLRRCVCVEGPRGNVGEGMCVPAHSACKLVQLHTGVYLQDHIHELDPQTEGRLIDSCKAMVALNWGGRSRGKVPPESHFYTPYPISYIERTFHALLPASVLTCINSAGSILAMPFLHLFPATAQLLPSLCTLLRVTFQASVHT